MTTSYCPIAGACAAFNGGAGRLNACPECVKRRGFLICQITTLGGCAVTQVTCFFDQIGLASLKLAQLLTHECSPEMKIPPEGGWLGYDRRVVSGVDLAQRSPVGSKTFNACMAWFCRSELRFQKQSGLSRSTVENQGISESRHINLNHENHSQQRFHGIPRMGRA